MQFYAIREKALADGNLKVAIECQRLLRQSDVFLRIVKDPKLVEKYGSSFGIGGTANMPVLTGRDEHDERLERAFSRSVAKPPPEEDPIDVEATPAGTED